jgi:hypothetical protein
VKDPCAAILFIGVNAQTQKQSSDLFPQPCSTFFSVCPEPVFLVIYSLLQATLHII